MKLLNAEVINFGSYDSLEFNFNEQNLALVYGVTGSGKSTLQDLPSWLLFGVTAKDGNADEIRSWNHPDEPTIGSIDIEVNGQLIGVHRIRGKATENDLYWHEGDDPTPIRGKDITETQKLLNDRLGVSKDLYIAAAYYNEFSPTGLFFTSKAKERRELFEKIVDLSLPTLLSERIASARKEAKKTYSERSEELNKAAGRLEQLKNSERAIKRDVEGWSKAQEEEIQTLKFRSEKFDEEKQSKAAALRTRAVAWEAQRSQKVNSLTLKLQATTAKIEIADSSKCQTCGNSNHPIDSYLSQYETATSSLSELQDQINPFISQITEAEAAVNHYLEQSDSETKKSNPFLVQLDRFSRELPKAEESLASIKSELLKINHKINSLNHLSDLAAQLRGKLLRNSIKQIEDETNRYLETYFESEIKVEFEMSDSDDLEVLVTKDGHSCVFRQLSKGQRGLLKLAFSVAVMTASSNRVGIHFDTLCFDEALDGLDSSLKMKAYNLLSELSLSHSTVLVIDHSIELQGLFTKHYHVTISQDGVSTIHDL